MEQKRSRCVSCPCGLQDEKHKAAAAERERRQREEATTSKAAQGSKQLVKQLQHKRFKQVRRLQCSATAAVSEPNSPSAASPAAAMRKRLHIVHLHKGSRLRCMACSGDAAVGPNQCVVCGLLL
jgi:hypothetical protein